LTYVLLGVTLWLRLGLLSAGCGQVAAPIVSIGSLEVVVVDEPVVGVPEGLVGVVELVVVVDPVGVLDTRQPPPVVDEGDVAVELVALTVDVGTVGVVELTELELDDAVEPA
jgi:hypothetical protein